MIGYLLHESSVLWFGYFWPSLKGNGPEALVQTAVYGAVAVLLVPVVRRAIRAEANRAHKLATGELTEVEEEVQKIERLWRRIMKRGNHGNQ